MLPCQNEEVSSERLTTEKVPVAASDPSGVEGVGDGISGLFDKLSETSRNELESRVRELRLPAGSTIFEVGDEGDALYIVKSGLIDVTSGGSAGHRIITLG